MQNLDLSGNGIGPRGIIALSNRLKKLPVLHKLNLSGNDIGPDGAMALSTHLEKLAALQNLDLSNNQLDPTSGTAVGKALALVTSLTALDIRGQDIGDGVWSVMSALLPRAAQLRVGPDGAVRVAIGVTDAGTSYMTLSGGKGLGPYGAGRLAVLLREACPPLLTALNLRGNQLGVAGWAAFGGELQRITSLTSLNGCGQYAAIRDGGLREVKLDKEWELGVWAARFLDRSASTLTTLDLRSNTLGPGGGTAIAGVLGLLTGLRSLDLRSNGLGAAGAVAVAEGLRSLTELRDLDMWDNGIGVEGVATVCSAAGNVAWTCLGVPFDVARSALLACGPVSGMNKPKVDMTSQSKMGPGDASNSCSGDDLDENVGQGQGSGKLGGWLEVRALLLAGGWSTALPWDAMFGLHLLYNELCSHETNTDALKTDAAAAGFTHVVVAVARTDAGKDTLVLAAAAAVAVALESSAGDDKLSLSHGVHWYCSRRLGFGFAPDDDFAKVDAGSWNHEADPLLSWIMDGQNSRYYSGIPLSKSKEYRKLVWGFCL
uniref:Uncharacterized protein n=1 Tax=Cryptomonas curvata TaxID=233186 RepID=A0A7S0MZH7_9CRYP